MWKLQWLRQGENGCARWPMPLEVAWAIAAWREVCRGSREAVEE